MLCHLGNLRDVKGIFKVIDRSDHGSTKFGYFLLALWSQHQLRYLVAKGYLAVIAGRLTHIKALRSAAILIRSSLYIQVFGGFKMSCTSYFNSCLAPQA